MYFEVYFNVDEYEALADGRVPPATFRELKIWFARFAVHMGGQRLSMAALEGSPSDYAIRDTDPSALVDFLAHLVEVGKFELNLGYDELYERLLASTADPRHCLVELSLGTVAAPDHIESLTARLKGLAEGPPPLPRKPWAPRKQASPRGGLWHDVPQRDPATGLPTTLEFTTEQTADGRTVPVIMWGPITTRRPGWTFDDQNTMYQEISNYMLAAGITEPKQWAETVREVTELTTKAWQAMLDALKRKG